MLDADLMRSMKIHFNADSNFKKSMILKTFLLSWKIYQSYLGPCIQTQYVQPRGFEGATLPNYL